MWEGDEGDLGDGFRGAFWGCDGEESLRGVVGVRGGRLLWAGVARGERDRGRDRGRGRGGGMGMVEEWRGGDGCKAGESIESDRRTIAG